MTGGGPKKLSFRDRQTRISAIPLLLQALAGYAFMLHYLNPYQLAALSAPLLAFALRPRSPFYVLELNDDDFRLMGPRSFAIPFKDIRDISLLSGRDLRFQVHLDNGSVFRLGAQIERSFEVLDRIFAFNPALRKAEIAERRNELVLLEQHLQRRRDHYDLLNLGLIGAILGGLVALYFLIGPRTAILSAAITLVLHLVLQRNFHKRARLRSWEALAQDPMAVDRDRETDSRVQRHLNLAWTAAAILIPMVLIQVRFENFDFERPVEKSYARVREILKDRAPAALRNALQK